MPRPRTISIYLVVHETGGGNIQPLGLSLNALGNYLEAAVEDANSSPVPQTNHLNLFMAPEFYLNEQTKVLAEPRFKNTLSTVTSWSRANPKWLIIPGTSLTEVTWTVGTEQRINVAPIFFNGALIHAYCKRYPGDTELVGVRTWAVDYGPATVSSDPIFVVSDVHFGIEICNDYRRGAFANWYDKTLGAAPGPGRPPYAASRPGVDVQLLPASGVSPLNTRTYGDPVNGNNHALNFGHARVRPNGYFAVCDGSFAPQPRLAHQRKTVVYKRQRQRFALHNQIQDDPRTPNQGDDLVFTQSGFVPVPGSLNGSIMAFRNLPLEYSAP